MKKWKKSVLIGGTGILAILLSACGKGRNTEEQNGKFYDCQRGFRSGAGNGMCETPDGYYMLVGNYLMFAEKDLKATTIVCNKAECLHCEEPMDHKTDCNAFFMYAQAVNYYDGKLYVLSKNFSEQNGGMSIFEVTPDGSSRRNIYKGGDETNAFAIHRGNAYVYEKKYADKDGKVYQTPHATIVKVSLKNPKKTSVLFDSDKYESLNRLTCYENDCYFDASYPLTDGSSQKADVMKIDLDSEKASVCEGLFDYSFGKGFIFNRILLESSDTGLSWKSGYNRCTLDGEVEKTYTEKDFSVIGRDTVSSFGADDKYLYFKDIEYGDHMVPSAERKIYVYTYEGKPVCEIPTGAFGEMDMACFYPGNEKYMFFCLTKMDDEGKGSYEYYYVDKERFGKDAKIEKFLSEDVELFTEAVSFTYE